MRYLQFEPMIPLALWCTMTVVAAGLLIVYGRSSRRRLTPTRWGTIMVLMALAFVGPMIILLNPTWVEQLPPPAGKPRLTILVDRSSSMAVADAAAGATRFEQACDVAGQVEQALQSQFDVQIRIFDEHSAPTSVDELRSHTPDGYATNLAASIDESLAEDLPQGQAMLLLSDGIHNAGGDMALRQAVAKAKTLVSPIYVQTLGGEVKVHDLAAELAASEELVFVGQNVPISLRLVQRGPMGQRVSVKLKHDDQVVERRTVELNPNEALDEVVHPVEFQITQDKPGLYRYQVEVDSLAEEVSSVNNVATLLLRVVDEPVQVLLLEGKPYWDTKFLVRTLAQDRSVELTSAVQTAPGRVLKRRISRPEENPPTAEAAKPSEGHDSTAAVANAAPTSPAETLVEEKPEAADTSSTALREDRWEILRNAENFLAQPETLEHVQIVVLGRDADVFLSDAALEQLRRWLASGRGALVCFRGAPESQLNQRLGKLMPVRWTPTRETRFRVSLDRASQAIHWLPASATADTLAAMPSLATDSRAESRSPQVGVLATAQGDTAPVVAYQEFGLGRVVVIEGAGMWRWAFLSPKHPQQSEIYGLLWRSLTRWLVSNVGLLPSQELALRMDRVTFPTKQNIVAQLLVREGSARQQVPDVLLTTMESTDTPKRITPLTTDEPERYVVPLGDLPEGRYSVRVDMPEVDESSGVALFDVRDNLRERLEVSARGDLMSYVVAQQSGGTTLEGEDVARQLIQAFDEHRAATRPEQVLRTSAWDRWWVLSAVFGGWALAWSVRRRCGLV